VELYEKLRHFADSWGLLIMTLFFLSALLWAVRPGSRSRYSDQSEIPFKHDDRKE
jgi:cytochrome c oxidase cbb3-type subunit 4